MGQYYVPASLDKKEWMYSHDYGNGLKLMEHSWIGNNFVSVVEHLLAPNGPWHKTKIVWGGDYGENKALLDVFEHVEDKTDNVYSYAHEFFKKINPEDKSHDPSLRFIVNHTKKQFVDKTKVQTKEAWGSEWQVHPLPLLTSDGNGQGGGDYSGNNEKLAGTWAGNVISMERTIPSDYEEFVPNFYE